MTPSTISNPTQTTLIYHGNCPDGFMAATIFRLAARPAKEIEFYPGVHQEAPPDVTGREVVLVDFSYKRPVILQMAQAAKSILVVDHHISAQKDLVDLPSNVKTVFDMNHSGAGLAWQEFMPGRAMPEIVRYVEVMDLGQPAALPNAREVVLGLRSHDYDLDLWTQFLEADQSQLIADLTLAGQAIARKRDQDLQAVIGTGHRQLEIGGQQMPVVNAPPSLRSAASLLLGPDQPLAAGYYIADGYAYFSLRSGEQGPDVSKIAVGYGGGGHHHQAGFRIKYDGANLAGELKRQFKPQ